MSDSYRVDGEAPLFQMSSAGSVPRFEGAALDCDLGVVRQASAMPRST